MEMVQMMVRYKVKKSKIGTVKRAIAEFVSAVRKKEPGTLAYNAFQEESSPYFTHFMSFKDKAAKKIHETSSRVQKFVSILYPNCDEEPVFTNLRMI